MLCCICSLLSTVLQVALLFLGLYLIVCASRWIMDRILIGGFHARPVLVTGCDTGFGHLLAIKLLENGVPVFAACLTDQGMDGLKKKATTLPGELHTFKMDVTSDESVNEAVKFVESKTTGLWGVVNNAGVMGVSAPDDWLTVKHYEQCLAVNTFGVIRVSHAFKHLVKRRQGRMVTVASIAGRLALPITGPYSVSKFAIEAYMDVLRAEMMAFGVKVSILEPGFFKTDLLDTDRAVRDTKQVWEQQSSDIKEQYGQAFFDLTMKARNEAMTDWASPDTGKVVDAYFHALMSRFPRERYQVTK